MGGRPKPPQQDEVSDEGCQLNHRLEGNGGQFNDARFLPCRAKNDEDIKAADEKITEAKEKFGEVEVFDRYSEKAALLARIGDVEGALKSYSELDAAVKHVSTGQKVDMAMAKSRMFLAASEWNKAKETITQAKE
jgi:26S proteasome subunit RPN7